MRTRTRGSTTLGLTALTVVGIGLGGLTLSKSPEPRATPAPSFTDFDKTDRATVLAYARSLDFGTVPGVTDTRPIANGVCAACDGKVLTIQPERGAFRLTRADLKQGRVLARIIAGSPHGETVPSAVEVFWWVGQSANGELISIMVPSDPSMPAIKKGLVVEEHSGFEWRQTIARWKWTEEDGGGGGTSWVSCMAFGCCRTN